jgi:hypothetical protein
MKPRHFYHHECRKEELDAMVGALAHGQAEEIFPRLQKLDAHYPNVAEIN